MGWCFISGIYLFTGSISFINVSDIQKCTLINIKIKYLLNNCLFFLVLLFVFFFKAMLLLLFSNNFSLMYYVTCLLIFHRMKKLKNTEGPWGLTPWMPLSQTMNVYKILPTFKYQNYFLYIYIYMYINTIYMYIYIYVHMFAEISAEIGPYHIKLCRWQKGPVSRYGSRRLEVIILLWKQQK